MVISQSGTRIIQIHWRQIHWRQIGAKIPIGADWRQLAPIGGRSLPFYHRYQTPIGGTANHRQNLAVGQVWRSPIGAKRRLLAPIYRQFGAISAPKWRQFGGCAQPPTFGANWRQFPKKTRKIAYSLGSLAPIGANLAPIGAIWRQKVAYNQIFHTTYPRLLTGIF